MLIKITIAENVRGFNRIFIFVYKSEVWEKFHTFRLFLCLKIRYAKTLAIKKLFSLQLYSQFFWHEAGEN